MLEGQKQQQEEHEEEAAAAGDCEKGGRAPRFTMHI